MKRLVRKMLVAGLCVLALTPGAWGISRDRIMASAGHPNDDLSIAQTSSGRGQVRVLLIPWPGIGVCLRSPFVMTLGLGSPSRTHGSVHVSSSPAREVRR